MAFTATVMASRHSTVLVSHPTYEHRTFIAVVMFVPASHPLCAKCPVSKIAFLSGESLLPMFALNLVCVIIPLGWSYQPIAIQLYV